MVPEDKPGWLGWKSERLGRHFQNCRMDGLCQVEAGVPQPAMEEIGGVSAKMSVPKENPASARAKTGSTARGDMREADNIEEYLDFQCPSPPLISQTERSSPTHSFPLPHRDH